MIFEKYFKTPQDATLPAIMIGEVVNNNDPQQMGRLQVHIASHSTERNLSSDLSHYPWASYGAPFGGIETNALKGPGNPDSEYPEFGDRNSGPVAYGMWAIPKVGARVIVCAVDNDPNQLYWIGCVYPNSTPHTLPHGRYSTRTGSGTPDGPFDTTETPIAPLYDNLTKAFSNRDNFEWRSRGADYQAAAATIKRVNDKDVRTGTLSEVHDDGIQTITEEDGNNFGKDFSYRQGYAESRSRPDTKWDEDFHILRDIDTDKLMESQVYSFTSPGFHSLSMDDRPENCRTRLRTTTGHQILMDDTNERIYVSTNEGRNWIEMDSDGHIYIYSEESISMRAEGDLNLTAEKTVRVTAKDGIHFETPGEMRTHVGGDTHTHVNGSTFSKTDGEKHETIDSPVTVKYNDTLDMDVVGVTTLELQSNLDLTVGGVVKALSQGDWNLKSTANIRITSSELHTETSGTLVLKSSNVELDAGGNLKHTASLTTGGEATFAGAIQSVGGDVSSDGNSLNKLSSNYDDLVSKYNSHTHTSASPGSPTSPKNQGDGTTSHSATSVTTDASPTGWGGSEPVSPGEPTEPELAFWTNIIPHHEPWARTFIKEYEQNVDHEPEYEYEDPNVGKSMKKVKDTDRKRGKLWHR